MRLQGKLEDRTNPNVSQRKKGTVTRFGLKTYECGREDEGHILEQLRYVSFVRFPVRNNFLSPFGGPLLHVDVVYKDFGCVRVITSRE